MFNYLPTETKLDIFKFLSYKELFSIKQTNLYFRDFIDKYEGELAREKVYTIHFDHTINQFKKDLHRSYKPKSKNYGFPLSEQLEENVNKLKYAKGFFPFLKKNGLENPIPMYLPYQNSRNIVSRLSKRVSDITNHRQLQLETIIKSKEDLKIVYYYLNKVFNCCYEYGYIDEFVFNPELIELLFGDNVISKQLYIRTCYMAIVENNIQNLISFALNHLISETLIINFLRDRADIKIYKDLLFKILINGDKFKDVYLRFAKFTENLDCAINVPMFYDQIVEYIATSKDCSKMVSYILIEYSNHTSFELSERAEKVEIEQINDMKYAYHEISNIYNPSDRYSFFHVEREYGGFFYAIINIKKVEAEGEYM
uniref:F-box domain-containing protein n=1 Tax=Meloidogyne enterolobii TaxID=390850 RepID=A0A6V7WR12_MELEN|nr:unnamed protein product [Meloidogyne enterolobii]